MLVAIEVLAANKVSGVEGSDESIEKYRKLSKTGKLSKSQKLAKSKKPSKSRNSPNFDAKKTGLSFLNPDLKTAFNHLRLAFTKAPILRHFDLDCYIWIKTDALGYAIGDVLS